MRPSADRAGVCRNCHQERPAGRLDRLRWCDRCRAEVVRRSAVSARVAAFLAALAVVAWIVAFVGPTSRFLMGWLVLIGAVYFFVYKLTQRVAFEIIRSRGVPPPPETDA